MAGYGLKLEENESIDALNMLSTAYPTPTLYAYS